MKEAPSIGKYVHRSDAYPESENKRFRLVAYWKNGQVEQELPPKAEGAVRFACISDTHNKTTQFLDKEFRSLNLTPEMDVDYLLHAGDFTGTGTNAQTKAFFTWIEEYGKTSVVIAGNHDTTFDAKYYKERGQKRFHAHQEQDGDPRRFIPANCRYLEDSETELAGLRIYGSPWQPEFCDWAFNLPRGPPLAAVWAKIPAETDILMTHGPAHGRLGGICRDGFDAGCEELLKRIRAVKPLVHVCGHVHEDYGVFMDQGVVIINASSVNLMYRPTNPPILFDVFPK